MPDTSKPTTGHTAFVYGTLMHPEILKQVIGHKGVDLQICPGVLLDHTRHRVNHADYPGMVPYSIGKVLFDRELGRDEKCVRGTLVFGLTEKDIELLDEFEGDEYTREKVKTYRLNEPIPLSQSNINEDAIIPVDGVPPLPADLGDAVDAETYIYGQLNNLKRELWSFDEFARENAWKWYGPEGGRQYPDGNGN